MKAKELIERVAALEAELRDIKAKTGYCSACGRHNYSYPHYTYYYGGLGSITTSGQLTSGTANNLETNYNLGGKDEES